MTSAGGSGIQPDQYWPTDAANYDSFAGFANKTQAEWETELVGGFNTAFGPWSGVCALLEQVPFVGDLIEMGGGPESGLFGLIGAMLEGLTVIAENVCALLLGTPPPSDTTPTSMLDGLTTVFDQLLNSPFVAGLIDLAEDTGNLLSDIITALLGFVSTLCSVFTGTYDPNATTPQTIVDGVTGVFTTISGSGFLQAFINFAQASGNIVIQILDGIVRWLDQAWQLIVAMFPTLFGKSPDDVLAESVADNITSIINDMITAAMDWLDALPELLSSVINAIIAMIAAIPQLILGVITGFLDWLEFLPEAVTALVQGLLAFITAIPATIASTIQTMLEWVTEIPELIGAVLDGVVAWVQAVPEIAVSLIEAVITLLFATPELVLSVVEALIGAIPGIGMIQDIIDKLIHAFGGSSTGGTTDRLYDTATDIVYTVYNANIAANGASGAVNGLIEHLVSAPSEVIGNISNVTTNNNYTIGQWMDALYAANSAQNTPIGGYGGTGAPGASGAPIPRANSNVARLYGTAQAASYGAWQQAASAGMTAADGAAGSPGSPYRGY